MKTPPQPSVVIISGHNGSARKTYPVADPPVARFFLSDDMPFNGGHLKNRTIERLRAELVVTDPGKVAGIMKDVAGD